MQTRKPANPRPPDEGARPSGDANVKDLAPHTPETLPARRHGSRRFSHTNACGTYQLTYMYLLGLSMQGGAEKIIDEE